MDLALFVLRIVVGLLFIGHGGQKLFGWFKGPGLQGFTGWLSSMGFKPAHVWAQIAAIAEFGGGILLALGLLNPLGSLGIAASMMTAIAKVHWPKIFVTENGIELPLVMLTVAFAVGVAGPGAISLDGIFNYAFPAWLSTIGVVLVLAGWVYAMVSTSRRQQGTAPSSH